MGWDKTAHHRTEGPIAGVRRGVNLSAQDGGGGGGGDGYVGVCDILLDIGWVLYRILIMFHSIPSLLPAEGF